MKVDSESKLDLELVLKAVQGADLLAKKIGNDVYVEWEMLRPRMPFGPASHAAERFLPVLNGMLALHLPAFHGLKLEGILGSSDDGQWIPISWKSLRVAGSNNVQQAMAFLEKGGPTIDTLYRLATTNAALAEALLYFGRDNEPFFDLYKAFEVVRETVGGQKQLEELGLATHEESERFTRSANDPAISGVFARHSHKSTDPMPDPMNEHQAREFVRTVLQKWILNLPDPSGSGSVK